MNMINPIKVTIESRALSDFVLLIMFLLASILSPILRTHGTIWSVTSGWHPAHDNMWSCISV